MSSADASKLGLALGANDFESALVEALAQGRPAAELHRCLDVVDLCARARMQEFATVVVEPNFPRLSGTVIERLLACGMPIVGLANTQEDSIRLSNWGITSIVQVDSSDMQATVAAIDAVSAPTVDLRPTTRRATGRSTRNRGRKRVVAVWGPPGAPGRTTVATTIAELLADRGDDTFLVDADTTSHGLSAHLAMQEEGSGLIAAAHNAEKGTLDPDSLARLARALNPKLRVLTGIPHVARRSEVRAASMNHVWQVAASMSDFVVADIGHCVDDVFVNEQMAGADHPEFFRSATHVPAMTALASASTFVAVTSCEPTAIARMLSYLGPIRSMCQDAALVVVINRVRAPVVPSRKVSDELRAFVASQTNADDVLLVRDDRETCDQAAAQGLTPFESAPKRPPTEDLRQLIVGLTTPVSIAS